MDRIDQDADDVTDGRVMILTGDAAPQASPVRVVMKMRSSRADTLNDAARQWRLPVGIEELIFYR